MEPLAAVLNPLSPDAHIWNSVSMPGSRPDNRGILVVQASISQPDGQTR
jgi:hypothetical protein